MKTSMKLVRISGLMMALVLFVSAGWTEEAQKIAELGSCTLENGNVVLDCRVGYRTFGTLNADRSNVVVMPSWLNGRSEDLVPLFGNDETGHRLVDTSRFFGVAFDVFGDGVSSSPSNSRRQHGPEFPVFTMEDIVRAQYRVLTEVLHVRHVHAAVGLSMGGEQVFAWAVLYPKFVDLAVPIVGTPQVTSFDLLSKQIVIDAIESDPDYKDGRYVTEPQLKLANAIGTMIVSAPQYRNAEVPRAQFAQWLKTIESPQRQDANDRVWQAKAIMHHDVLHGRTIGEVAREVPVKFLVIVAAEDRMVTPQPALEWAKAVGAETYVSTGSCAHLIMNCDAEAVSSRVERFLAR
ncbi:alpha/beta fold hydrolase [Tunturiibacter empetritectus]|uniref:Homoserine O-acetyltransferase n=1 Tax=Tunturiibacter lichenicola TaxID=2051959 RepID=A0A852VDG7_9BACT|nr:alpha/beta fold hydrolase [Edaphobacter lichenicola]NYF89527.1 homoserine O-acetyltransferase [Edaphobacter lichenicola]